MPNNPNGPPQHRRQQPSSQPQDGHQDRRNSTSPPTSDPREGATMSQQDAGGSNPGGGVYRGGFDTIACSFLKVGLVFDLWLPEPMGEGRPRTIGSASTVTSTTKSVNDGGSVTSPNSEGNSTKRKEAQNVILARQAGVHLKLRPMVVVKQYEGRSICCALRSYDEAGLGVKLKKGKGRGREKLRWQAAIVYSMNARGEVIEPERESYFPKGVPIFYMNLFKNKFEFVKDAHFSRRISAKTIIDFGKTYNVENNVRIRPRGYIESAEQKQTLEAFYVKVFHFESWQPKADDVRGKLERLEELLRLDIAGRTGTGPSEVRTKEDSLDPT